MSVSEVRFRPARNTFSPQTVITSLADRDPKLNAWMQAFGQRFRAARIQAGLSQAEVSLKLYGSTARGQAYISKVERGQANLRAETMLMLSGIVGQDPNTLICPIPHR